MDESQNPAEAPTQNRTGEIVGMAAGIACILVLAFLGELKQVLPTGAAAVVLPVVFFSAVAGVVACALSLRDDALYLSPRIGFRAGLIATLLGSGGIVLAATLAQFGLSTTVHGWGFYQSIGSLILPQALIAQACILAALSIPPSLVFGIAGAFLVGFLRLPALDANKPTGTSMPRSAIFKAALLTAVLCYLSPFALVLRPQPKAPSITITPPSTAAPLPAPPKWRYEKPAGFETLDAERIAIVATRQIPEVSPDLPIAISPDGLRLAYCLPQSQNRVRVIDLNTLDTVAEETPPDRPENFAWSSDSKLLLFPAKGQDRWLYVIEAGGRRLMRLPKPKKARIPDGRPNWWSPDEVIFAGASIEPWTLDLDMLRVRPAAESAKWKALPQSEQDRTRTVPTLPVVDRAPWKLGIEARVRQYDVPMNPSERWQLSENLHLAIRHSERAYRTFPAEFEMNTDDAVLAASDGTKVIRIRGQQATIYFFGARAERSLSFKATIPGPPNAALSELLAKKELCAFVCAPLINPLNGKTVGPDRDAVKAIARVSEWKGSDAQLWIEEEYSPVEAGDVLADLHTWKMRKPTEAGSLGTTEWFAVISKLESISPIPLKSDAPELDRKLGVVFNTATGASKIEKILQVAPHPSSAPVAAPLPAETPPLAPIVRARGVSPETQQHLLRFIVEHHAKSSRGDIDGLIADYTNIVDHFDNGGVTKDFIRNEEIKDHPPGMRTTETVTGEVILEHLGSELFSARYPIFFRREHQDGRITEGTADVSLKMNLLSNGAEIYWQRASVRNRQKSP